MKRLFWIAVGASAGVLVVRRVTRAADSVSPRGLAAALGSLGDGVRVFADEVRAGMDEREAELRGALGLDGGAEVPPGQVSQSATGGTVHPSRPGDGPGDTR